MEKFVITYLIGDYSFSSEIVECIQYESMEKLKFDLELFLTENFQKTGEIPLFCELQFHPSDFFVRNKSGNKKGQYHYCPPQIQTLDEWFESKTAI